MGLRKLRGLAGIFLGNLMPVPNTVYAFVLRASGLFRSSEYVSNPSLKLRKTWASEGCFSRGMSPAERAREPVSK